MKTRNYHLKFTILQQFGKKKFPVFRDLIVPLLSFAGQLSVYIRDKSIRDLNHLLTPVICNKSVHIRIRLVASFNLIMMHFSYQ
jgi:hypothetical protein